MDWNYITFILTIATTTALATWSLAAFQSKQFAVIRALIDSTNKEVVNKLEYHERHDDSRFAQVINDLWELRLQAAMSPKRKSKSEENLQTASE